MPLHQPSFTHATSTISLQLAIRHRDDTSSGDDIILHIDSTTAIYDAPSTTHSTTSLRASVGTWATDATTDFGDDDIPPPSTASRDYSHLVKYGIDP